ncbi:MAG TPA: hypothetical protein VFB21_24435 [Chthonomonadaceae bacterium]|nr:hypothetical protein [Chthonomonadaceae bacterium]
MIRITTPRTPPTWALLERELLRANTAACREYFARYFDERGFLRCVERWGGNDGPDDAMESCVDWPLLHALGADDVVLEMVNRAWEGHLRQYTQARTTEVPFARDGMYYKEFPVMFDWLHNGEGLGVFNLLGLSDPQNPATLQRFRRYAGFYMNEDPDAPNYDPEHKIIRSLFNGSRGPLLRPATALDWAGDPIEVGHRFKARHGERTYEEMLAHFQDYTDVVGDHPSNLAATSLALNAYLLTHEEKYKDWLLEYVDAWAERARANGGLLPSKIGLDGKIGGPSGKWYAGCYGWGFTVVVPQTGELAHRSTTYVGLIGFGNAFLLTGDEKYLDVWRNLLDTINAQSRVVNGSRVYPHNYGDEGWYNFQPHPYLHGALDLWYWSQQPTDRERLPDNDWLAYLEGRNPDYPEQALQADFARIRERVEGMRADPTTPDTRLSDDPMVYNPCSVASLLHLMLGGIRPSYWGGPLHCRVRYFDPERRRAGLPADVGALMEKLSADETVLTLVNLHQVEPRTVILQAGAYGEHQIMQVMQGGREIRVGSPCLSVRLEPGAGEQLTLRMRLYANRPTLARPWDRLP